MRYLATLSAISLAILMSATAGAQQVPANWDSVTAFTGGGLVRGSDGNYYRCMKNNTNHDPTKDGHIYWELYYVRTPTFLQVGSSGYRFSSLKSAWAMCSSAMIVPAAGVQIVINSVKAPFTETFSTPFSLDAESGQQITIVGDNINRVTYHFNGGSFGFQLDNGHTLGGLEGITIDGSGGINATDAVLVDQRSALLVSSLIVKNCYFGIHVDHDSYMKANGVQITGTTTTAVWADNHSHIDCTSGVIDGGGTTMNGVLSTTASHVDAWYCNVSNMAQLGFQADNMSTIDATHATAKNDVIGFTANRWSTINALNGICQNNTSFGMQVLAGGHIDATGATVSSNTNDYNVTPNTNAAQQSYILH